MPPFEYCYHCDSMKEYRHECVGNKKQESKPKMAQYMKMINVPIGYRFTVDGDPKMYVRMSDTHYKGWNGEFIINCFADGAVKSCHHIDVGKEVLVRLP